MTKKKEKTPGELPQSSENWYFAIRRLRTWLKDEGEEPLRPYVSIVVDLNNGLVLASEISKQPEPAEAQATLMSAMLEPPADFKILPHRPARVLFEDRTLMEALTPALQGIGIETRYRPQPEMDELVKDLEAHLNGGQPELPGLLAQRKVTARMVASLFASAADFYRAAPWVQLANEDALSILAPPQKEPYFAVVMGQAGMEYGLALYRRWEDLERFYQPYSSPEDIIPPGGLHSLYFNPVTEVPFADLDAIEKYGWEIAGPEAYPVPLIFLPSEGVQRPDRDELLWYEAALRAIPIFVQDHLHRNAEGEIETIEVEISVATSAGPVPVHIKYPAGELQRSRQLRLPVEVEGEGSQPIAFDRRRMERDLARMTGMLADQETDPQLQKAQEIIYDAWEETNHTRRIALARKALQISKNCADAYVLLAEEEADTLPRALEYYQEGVRAGERALGEAYVKENAGHFWGLLETRPYMRAMEGLASCLWQMGRKEEALQTFREMLRLNPGDNQGIRYILIDLLMNLNREKDLEKLLEEYEDDWSAIWSYTRALLAYRKGGASKAANQALRAALEQNRFVPDYLTGKKRVPGAPPEYIGVGDDTEAGSYAVDHLNHWRQTPGAVEWLQKEFETLPPAKASKKLKAGKSKKSRRGKAGPQPGDIVAVKPGVSDPDFGIEMGGWQGEVIDIEEGDVVLVEWDAQTLQNMPIEVIEKSEEEGLDWSQMSLLPSEVEPAEPRGTPAEREAVYKEINRSVAWLYLGGEEGRRIQAVMNDVDPEDEQAAFLAWENHLRARLKFPFQAKVSEYQEHGPLQKGDRVKVTGLAEVDNFYGVLVSYEKQGMRSEFPLCDLEVANKRSENYHPVEDYAVWFTNR